MSERAYTIGDDVLENIVVDPSIPHDEVHVTESSGRRHILNLTSGEITTVAPPNDEG